MGRLTKEQEELAELLDKLEHKGVISPKLASQLCDEYCLCSGGVSNYTSTNEVSKKYKKEMELMNYQRYEQDRILHDSSLSESEKTSQISKMYNDSSLLLNLLIK